MLEKLLKKVDTIMKVQKAEERIKGELFNIFEILNVETKETSTHSNFIGALLNRHGKHFKGNAFLKLFLEGIGEKDLDVESTNVYLERHIGEVKVDKENNLASTGGRIDIYLEDKNGQSISIENKIYATDQPAQIIRYHNYNKGKNKVYYLNLDGAEPAKDSFSDEKLGTKVDYKAINYAEHILDWLDKAHQLAVNDPILRETIRQYNFLIKKLTNSMDNQHEEKLIASILADFEAAKLIEANVQKARKTICQKLFDTTFQQIKNLLKDHPEFEPEQLGTAGDKFACIDIKFKNFKTEGRKFHFDLESFSGNGHYNGQLFIGILNVPPHSNPFANLPENRLSVWKWMINEYQIPAFDGTIANLTNAATIQRLHNEAGFLLRFAEYLAQQAIAYVEQQFPSLKPYLEPK